MEVALIAVVVVEDPWQEMDRLSDLDRRKEVSNGRGLSAWNVANANPYVY
jgi:hypothetical protein